MVWAALARFYASYNITGNETVPVQIAAPPRKIFNESDNFFGVYLENTCPSGASVADHVAIRVRAIMIGVTTSFARSSTATSDSLPLWLVENQCAGSARTGSPRVQLLDNRTKFATDIIPFEVRVSPRPPSPSPPLPSPPLTSLVSPSFPPCPFLPPASWCVFPSQSPQCCRVV